MHTIEYEAAYDTVLEPGRLPQTVFEAASRSFTPAQKLDHVAAYEAALAQGGGVWPRDSA